MFRALKKQVAKLTTRELAEWRRYYPREVVRQVTLEPATDSSSVINRVKQQVIADYWLANVEARKLRRMQSSQ